MGEESFFPFVPTAVTAATGLLLAALVVMALFGRLPRGPVAVVGGIVFGAAQTFLLWYLDLFRLSIGILLGALAAVVVGVLLLLFLRKAEA